MSNKPIVKVVEKNEAISVKLESVTFNSIRGELTVYGTFFGELCLLMIRF